MKIQAACLMTLTAMATLASPASALSVKEKDVVNKVRETTLSQAGQGLVVLADARGMSLYTFDLDSSGKSACSGSCLSVWPPLNVAANTVTPAPFGKIKGNNGKPQLTLNGLPLYHFGNDKKPGDTNGNYPQWKFVQVVK